MTEPSYWIMECLNCGWVGSAKDMVITDEGHKVCPECKKDDWDWR